MIRFNEPQGTQLGQGRCKCIVTVRRQGRVSGVISIVQELRTIIFGLNDMVKFLFPGVLAATTAEQGIFRDGRQPQKVNGPELRLGGEREGATVIILSYELAARPKS
jgi:hypothetical protein